MKTKTIILFFIVTLYCMDSLAQEKLYKDTATYDYAILKFYRQLGSYNLEIILPDNQIIDLTKKLRLDTVKLPEYNNTIDQKFVFKGIYYLDKMGYELVSSALSGNAREYIFRKKIKTLDNTGKK